MITFRIDWIGIYNIELNGNGFGMRECVNYVKQNNDKKVSTF